jgi:hypothetical protein
LEKAKIVPNRYFTIYPEATSSTYPHTDHIQVSRDPSALMQPTVAPETDSTSWDLRVSTNSPNVIRRQVGAAGASRFGRVLVWNPSADQFDGLTNEAMASLLAWDAAIEEISSSAPLRNSILRSVMASMAFEGFEIDEHTARRLLDEAISGPPLVIMRRE